MIFVVSRGPTYGRIITIIKGLSQGENHALRPIHELVNAVLQRSLPKGKTTCDVKKQLERRIEKRKHTKWLPALRGERKQTTPRRWRRRRLGLEQWRRRRLSSPCYYICAWCYATRMVRTFGGVVRPKVRAQK